MNMNQTDIYLVRHGETHWNADRRIQGVTEASLNDKGREQAQKVGQELSNLCIEAVYSFPLKRAQETSEIIGAFHGCGLFIDAMLHEGKFGELEGTTISDFYQKYAEAIRARHELSRKERLHHKYVPGSESIHEIVTRVVPSLQHIARTHMGENVIVVTHGFVMGNLLVILGGDDEREILVGNGGVLHLKGDGLTLYVVKHQGIEFKTPQEIEFRMERIRK